MRCVVILLLTVPLMVFCQKQDLKSDYIAPIDSRNCQANFQTVKLGSNDPSIVEQFLREHYSNVSKELPDVSLKLINNIESPGGSHLQYQQLYKNIPVYRGVIKANLDKNGNITSVFDNTWFTGSEISGDFPGSSLLTQYRDNAEVQYKIEKNYFFEGHNLLPLIRFEVSKNNGAHYEFFMDKDGRNVYQHDLNSYYHPKSMSDSIIKAAVFNPDPLTTAGVTYGTPYIDSNNSDVPELNAQRDTVNLKVDFANDTFRLKSPYVIIVNLTDPATAAATTTTNFIYTRAESGFEDVNAFYHINVLQHYIQSLGFANLNYQIWVDTHANNGDDNSLFNPSGNLAIPCKLQFGDGGVDDAEDADVIIHEYGHAIAYYAAPGANNGSERLIIDEGDGDYLASSYSRALNPFMWWNVFSWDGHNEFWPGRVSITNEHYSDIVLNSLYHSAPIWSSTLMQLDQTIGRDVTSKLLFQSMYSFAVGMTMPQAAELMMKADSLFYGGTYHNNICAAFMDRGISTTCVLGINELSNGSKWAVVLNSLDFGSSGAELIFKEALTGSLSLRDVTGKLVFSDHFFQKSEYPLNGDQLANGLYILTVQSGSKTANFKLGKF